MTSRRIYAALLLATLCGSAAAAGARGAVVFVKADAAGANDGTSWTDAYTSLQTALAAAQPGDELWVAAGTYKPSSGLDRNAAFALRSGIALYGGFAGTETARDQRDVVANETILSGDLAGNDDPGPGFAGSEENSYHVVTALNVDATAVLDGFTVCSGRADGPNAGANPASRDQGSAVNVFDASPVIANCTFRRNWAANHGTINDHGIASTVVNCTFRDNYAAGFGGGLYIHHHSDTLAIDCTFIDNVSSGDGAGAYSRSEHMATLMNCTFVGNSANRGGGLYTDPDSNTVVIDCLFLGNRAGFGAAIYNDANATTIDGCTFEVNESQVGGAGVYNNRTSATVFNCTFTDNVAAFDDPSGGGGGGGSGGAGLWNDGGSPTVTDCIFTANLASFGSGIYNGAGSLPVIARCQFIDNLAGEGAAVYSLISDAVVDDCVMIGNRAEGTSFSVGGAVSNYFCNPHFTRCVFVENSAELGGGAAYNEGETAVLTSCRFYGNFTFGVEQGWGGAVLNSFAATPLLTNCLFSGNTGRLGGALFNTVFCDATITNCTFSENTATGGVGEFGGAIYNSNSTTTIVANCIVWQNHPDNIAGDALTASHSCVQGGYPGTANLDLDPQLVSPFGADLVAGTPDDDLRLRAASPCIDTGDASLLPPDVHDLDGDNDTAEPTPLDVAGLQRVRGSAVDMGAHESPATPSLIADMNCDDVADFGDVVPFASALVDPAAYDAAQPTCDIHRADINADGLEDGADVAAFVDLLLP